MGGVQGNRTFKELRGKVEDFDSRGNRHDVAEEGEGQCGISGLAGHEHVMRPYEEADDRDSDTRSSDKRISEDGFASEGGNDFAGHPHRWKNHDVNGVVRI